MAIRDELIEELLKDCGDPAELLKSGGFLKELSARLIERVLQAELDSHLGFERHAVEGRGSGNSRNGSSYKTLKTDLGEVDVAIPRDRRGTFEPKLVKKHQRRLEGFDEKVIALYSGGMTVRDIQSHLSDLYGTEVSPDLISRVTDAVVSEMATWQTRPLDPVWPVLYLDALVVKVRDQGVVRNKHVYVALGINAEGAKEVLGIWMETNEGAKFWLKVLTDLKNRGLVDALVVCCDGLKGFPEAIETALPKATVQTCIVHLIRASLRHVPYKEMKPVAQALRPVYTAVNEDAALAALEAFEASYGTDYPSIGASWRANWVRVVPFLAFPAEIRRVIYTTNAIESLNSSLRKALRNRGHFPNDDAALKLVYMALARAERSWKMPFRDWKRVAQQFAIYFDNRLAL